MYQPDFTKQLFEKCAFPADACAYLTACEERICASPVLDGILSDAVSGYMTDKPTDLSAWLDRLSEAAPQFDLHPYTMHLLFALRCMPILHGRYLADARLTEEMFWEHAVDLRCKLNECIECKGIVGSFVAPWFAGMFDMTRFALGRFQYVLRTYTAEPFVTPMGYAMNAGDPYVEFHIPSTGVPLTDDVRMDSYRRAYRFYRDTFPADKPVVLATSTWLLYPEHRKFLPPHSNLLRFLDDFHIAFSSENPAFSNAWRLFGASAERDPADWYDDTSLRRAYKNYILSGGVAGSGWGFMFMQNEQNITHQPAEKQLCQ